MSLIKLSKLVKSGIQRDDFWFRAVDRGFETGQADPDIGAPSFLSMAGSRIIDKNPSHQSRRDREKMKPALPIDIAKFGQTQVSFIHERGRLQRMVLLFLPKPTCGLSPQYYLNQH